MTQMQASQKTATHQKISSLLWRFRLHGPLGRFLIALVPYAWTGVFFLIPFLIIFKISFTEMVIGSPPYTPMLEWTNETLLTVRLNFWNYVYLLQEDLYFSSFLNSLSVAALATFFAFLIGYPMAYGIARTSSRWQILMLMLIILPFWTSFLIRVYAWMGILGTHGIINTLLLKFHLIKEPLLLMNNKISVCLGMVYTYLPFMILPIYATLEKLDVSLLEAAYDLGCRPLKAFLKITFPLSLPGVLTGAMLVFIPSVGEYVIPELLGGADSLMIGRILWGEFFSNNDWPMAAAIAVTLLVILVIPIMVLQTLQRSVSQ